MLTLDVTIRCTNISTKYKVNIDYNLYYILCTN